MCIYFFLDCFWLLSAFIEYSIHNNVYRLFKERTAENFENNEPLPKRLLDLGFEKYSKLSKTLSSFLECPKFDFEPNYPINRVTIQNLPSKKYVI
jgi:hypothetical protein